MGGNCLPQYYYPVPYLLFSNFDIITSKALTRVKNHDPHMLKEILDEFPRKNNDLNIRIGAIDC
jgi:hypothetical protein